MTEKLTKHPAFEACTKNLFASFVDEFQTLVSSQLQTMTVSYDVLQILPSIACEPCLIVVKPTVSPPAVSWGKKAIIPLTGGEF